MLITALLILVLLLGIRVWWRKTDDASNNAKDDNSSKASDAKDDDSSKASTTSKLDKAKEVAQKSGKKAKDILSAVANIISSVFWWSILLGIGYLFISFGYSIYQDAHDFMSNPPATTSVVMPSPVVHKNPPIVHKNPSVIKNRIIDGRYQPDRQGILLFKTEDNASYEIRVRGCELQIEAKYTYGTSHLKLCPNGKDTTYGMQYHFDDQEEAKGAVLKNEYDGIAILVIQFKGKILKKIPIGDSLYTLKSTDFPTGSEVKLYANYSAYEEPTKGGWDVTVDKI